MVSLINAQVCNARRVVRLIHKSYPVIAEESVIRLAKLPASAPLHKSVLVHPRYVEGRGDIDHVIIEVRGRVRGRTIDVLLDEPFEFDGKEYGIMNFKGVGADADRELVLHPSLWFCRPWKGDSGQWGHVDSAGGDIYRRVWGALRRYDARAEFCNDLLPSLGVPQIPHVSLNPIPDKLTSNIRRIESGQNHHNFSQLVRAFNTNIRMDEVSPAVLHLFEPRELAVRIARIDAALLVAQLRLAMKGEMLTMMGSSNENRFVDGVFTDAENMISDSFDLHQSNSLIVEILHASKRFFSCLDILGSHYLVYLSEFETFIRSRFEIGEIERNVPTETFSFIRILLKAHEARLQEIPEVPTAPQHI